MGVEAQHRRNTGSRPGREVVQAYLTGAPGNGGQPVRVLGAFTGVTAAPGEAAEVMLRVPARLFAVFDEEAGQWSWPQGEFTVQVGRSSRDLRLSLTVRSGLTGPGNASGRSRRRDELDLVAVPVLQVGRVVVEAARVRVAIAEQQPPPVLWRLVGELVHLFPGGDMEGQMVHSGAAPVVTAGHAVG